MRRVFFGGGYTLVQERVSPVHPVGRCDVRDHAKLTSLTANKWSTIESLVTLGGVYKVFIA